jgi:hypothetical protein
MEEREIGIADLHLGNKEAICRSLQILAELGESKAGVFGPNNRTIRDLAHHQVVEPKSLGKSSWLLRPESPL